MDLEGVEHHCIEEAHFQRSESFQLGLRHVSVDVAQLLLQTIVCICLSHRLLSFLIDELVEVRENLLSLAHDRARLGALNHIFVEKSELEHNYNYVEGAKLVKEVKSTQTLRARATLLHYESVETEQFKCQIFSKHWLSCSIDYESKQVSRDIEDILRLNMAKHFLEFFQKVYLRYHHSFMCQSAL